MNGVLGVLRELAADPVFAAAGAVCAGAGVMVVTRRNPIYSAIWMLVSFLALAVLYLRLHAPFLAAIHVLVYTGAILVLFLFVIMLLNLKEEELGQEYPLPIRGVVALLCLGLFALLALPFWMGGKEMTAPATAPADFGSVRAVGNALFKEHAFPFELISGLILTAVFGGVVLAKKKL